MTLPPIYAGPVPASGAGSPVGVVTPQFVGQIYEDTTPGPSWIATGLTDADWFVLSASAAPGASIVRAFPFTFDTPDILTGAALYTPTPGDILLDAWIEVDTAWNGITPFGDFGTFVGMANGWLSWQGSGADPLDMTAADNVTDLGTLLVQAYNGNERSSSLRISATYGYTRQARFLPGKFATDDPVKVVVSQNGTNSGLTPASTQGAGVLYLVTATPE